MFRLSAEEIAQIVEFGEVEAYTDLWLAASADFAATYGLRLERIGSAVVIMMAAVDFGSTLPAYRRRGAQGAIMAQRIRDGAALGCRWLITETGEDRPNQPNPSYHNMVRTGFTLAYLRPNYIFKAQ